MSTKNKTQYYLIVVSFVLITLVIIAGGYFAYKVQVKGVTNSRYNELAAIRSLKVQQIVGWRNERISDGKAILENPLITKDLKLYSRTRDKEIAQDIYDWFQILKQSYRYAEVILVDKYFTSLISSEHNSGLESQHIQAYQKDLAGDEITISPLHKQHSKFIHFTIRITFKENDEPYCHLLLLVDPNDFLFPLIQNWPTPSRTAETILVQSEGDSLVILNELRHIKNSAFEYKIPKSLTQLPSVQAVQGHEGMFIGYDYRGEKVLADIGPIPGTDWFIIAKVDEGEILGVLKSSLINNVIIVLLLIAILYLLFTLILRRSKLNAIKTELVLQSEKIRLSRLYATLSQINQAIVREQSKSELLLTITQLPVKYGDFKACSISIFDEQSGKLHVESFAGNFDYFNKILNDASEYQNEDPSVTAFNKSATVFFNNIRNDEAGWMKIASKFGFKSCGAAPLIVFEKTIGSLILYSDIENFFQNPEITLLEEITSDISFSLETIEKNEKRKIVEKQIEENERRLATLFSNLPGIAYRCKVDSDWTMEFMSEGAINIIGYSPEEIIEEKLITYNNIILPEDRQFVHDEIMTAIKDKKAFSIVYRIQPRSGRFRWVWEKGTPVFNVNGKVLALEGFISDITDTKETQDQLRKSEEYFRYLFHNNPLPMWIYDFSSYHFMEVNEAAISTYGYSRDEFLSMRIFDIRPIEDIEKLKEDLGKPRAVRSISGEWKHKYKNGKISDVFITSHQIEYDNKPAVLVVSMDINDRKLAEKALLSAKEKAESGEKMKTEFLAQMSHEIRTPVNVILSFTNLIKEAVYSNLDDDLIEGFNAIDHASHRLIRTIDSVLNMAQITSGAFEVKLETMDIYDDILLPLNQEFKSIATSKNLNFSTEKYCENTIIISDRYSLSQLFTNLIDNAIKYTEQGFVKVSLVCDEHKVIVTIQDSGIGISEEFLPKLFSAFSQEETGYSRKYEGAGLGLALVKNYCDMNNAKIEVQSKKDVGTTFTVTLFRNISK